MTEYNKAKFKALEDVQAYMLQLKTALEYAEHALEHCIDENYEDSDYYLSLAHSTATGVQDVAIKPPKGGQVN